MEKLCLTDYGSFITVLLVFLPLLYMTLIPTVYLDNLTRLEHSLSNTKSPNPVFKSLNDLVPRYLYILLMKFTMFK